MQQLRIPQDCNEMVVRIRLGSFIVKPELYFNKLIIQTRMSRQIKQLHHTNESQTYMK